MEQIIFGGIRVQILSEDVVRIEAARKGEFCDQDTFFIPGRSQYAGTKTAYSVEENVICFGEYELYLPEDGSSLKGVHLEKNGKRVYTYRKKEPSGELPPVRNTPEVFPVFDCPRILLPEGGYSAHRKGEYVVEEGVQDVYLLLCGKDFKKLRRLYVELTGRCELVRLSTLGGWESKYYPYTQEEAKELILTYEKYGIPLDNMVIDTDWRDCADGWGYDINTKLFPDMKGFFDFAHKHGVEIMFNDHPEPVAGTKSVFDPAEIAYREEKLQGLLSLGLDTWWYDRNWGTHLFSPTDKVYWETFGLYLFTDITRHFYEGKAEGKPYRRPVIMGNVVNIANGGYQGIKDTASHRYSIQWTGDIFCDGNSLAREVASLVRGSLNCIPYINADCGGHLGNPDKEQFIRWMQFGTLSPVFRPHCTNVVKRTRDPWVYDEETLSIVREYNLLRYRLLPVLYRAAHESYQEGAPLCRPLSWNYPDDRRADSLRSYMLGENILVQPVAGIPPADCIPRKNFVGPVKATYFAGRKLEGEPIAKREYRTLNMVLERTSPEKGVPINDFSARFEATVQFNQDTPLFLCVDDGATVWVDGEKVLEDDTLHSAMTFALKTVEGGKPHDVRVDYFQANGEACCKLQCGVFNEGDDDAIYLPARRWLDAFDGKIYAGRRTIGKKYGLKEMPLFVRLGAVIPLAYEAKNTKEQKWDKLVFDCYPDKESADRGYLYEDDGETVAYQKGAFRTSEYEGHFDDKENAYILTLFPAEGTFEGERAITERDIKVKLHALPKFGNVKKVTVNGEEVPHIRAQKDSAAFPLNTGDSAPDHDVVSAVFRADVQQQTTVKFYL